MAPAAAMSRPKEESGIEEIILRSGTFYRTKLETFMVLSSLDHHAVIV
jgi:hypothetical protein